MKNSQIHAPGAKAPTAPTQSERMDAIERFLEQLVLLLEVEPRISRETMAAWLDTVSASARAHRLETPRQSLALSQLKARVLGTPGGLQARPGQRAA